MLVSMLCMHGVSYTYYNGEDERIISAVGSDVAVPYASVPRLAIPPGSIRSSSGKEARARPERRYGRYPDGGANQRRD